MAATGQEAEMQKPASNEAKNTSLSSASSSDAREGTLSKRRRKNRGGNTARRRRAKQAEHATTATAHINNHVASNSSRAIALPGVIERRGTKELSPESDREMLIKQLGYLPGNALAVVGREDDAGVHHLIMPQNDLDEESSKRHRQPMGSAIFMDNCDKSLSSDTNCNNAPTVLKLYPLAARIPHKGGKGKGHKDFKARKRGISVSGKAEDSSEGNSENRSDKQTNNWVLANEHDAIIEPFPTIFWLTNPKLRILISKLEDMPEYNVKTMQERLRNDPEAMKCMEKAHTNYGIERWNLLTQDDREEVTRRKWNRVLQESGIAGIQNIDSVKCLHTHAAHYLSGEKSNVVGRWTMEALQEQYGKKIRELVNVVDRK